MVVPLGWLGFSYFMQEKTIYFGKQLFHQFI